MRRALFIIPAVVFASFPLDQLSKAWAVTHLAYCAPQEFIPGLLKFTYTTNSGGAFGLACGNNSLLACTAAGVVSGILAWVVFRELKGSPIKALELAGVGFIVGGALGNLYDRITLGHVRDFLDFAFISFPVFNLADVFVDVGIALIIIASFL